MAGFVKFVYDQEGDALAIRLLDGIPCRTVQVDGGTLIDLDEHGRLVAIEVIRPHRDWPLDEILGEYELLDEQITVLRSLRTSGDRPIYPFGTENRTGSPHLLPA